MSEREYIVTLKDGVDKDQFNAEMTASKGVGVIPPRAVDVVELRPGNKRNTHYALNETEVKILLHDSRVEAIEIPPEQRDDIEAILVGTQSGNFSKFSSSSGNYLNWGMRRCIDETNNYSGSSISGDYEYNLDGTGVDVVIVDSGVQKDHPEFNDENGVSRYQEVDWYDLGGSNWNAYTQDSIFHRDVVGHGTHVASTAAGLTYGWAKNAHVYSMKLHDLSADPLHAFANSGILAARAYEIIKDWHIRKNDPNDSIYTGRPTVVNNSWGYSARFENITGGNYRGVNWTGTSADTSKGMVGSGNRFGVRVAAVQADVEQMIDAGVHMVVASGNSKQKIDVVGGVDYNNYFTRSDYPYIDYYNRGATPGTTNGLWVGNISVGIYSDGLEQKYSSSETGPGVNIYAPGTWIRGAISNTNQYNENTQYYLNSNFKQSTLTGTSMASPQVCGVVACALQAHPNMTPAEMKSMVIGLAIKDKLTDGGTDADYTVSRYLLGGNNRYLFFPYSRPFALTVT